MPSFLRSAARMFGKRFRQSPVISTIMVGAGLMLFLAHACTRDEPPAQSQEPARPVQGHFAGTMPVHDMTLAKGVQEARREQERLRRQIEDQQKQITALIAHIQQAPPVAPAHNGTVAPAMSDEAMRDMLRQEAWSAAQALRNVAPSEPPPIKEAAPPMQFHEPDLSHLKDVKEEPHSALPAPPLSPSVRLPAGSIANGRSINGLTALANQKNLPVTIALDTDFHTPNDAMVPLRDCHVVANVELDNITARGLVALKTLSCVLPNGEHIDQEIVGWVTAQDNVNGQWCEVFWNDKQVLRFFAQASIPASIAALLDGLQDVSQTVSVFGTVHQSGGHVAQEIFGEMGRMLLDRVQDYLYPVVWCPENEPVNVYIQETATLANISPDAWHPPVKRVSYD